MKHAVKRNNIAQKFHSKAKQIRLFFIVSILSPLLVQAEFSLNFQGNPNVVSSIANQSCNSGGDGGMMDGMGGGGMMGGIGPGCGSDPFLQEIVSDGGTQYYHVILEDQTQDFAIEYYMRSGGCCWWFSGGGGMGGMMGDGGDAPYSSSYGNVDDQLINAWLPLAGAADSGNGTGNPSRIYMRQINNDGQMNQEFIKQFEARKPRIIQDISSGGTQLAFDLDMSNGGYTGYTSPSQFINAFTSNDPDVVDFDMNMDAPQSSVSAGRFSYNTGPNDGGSSGTFNYESNDAIDVYNIDWLSYCDPSQNQDHSCNFSNGGGGGGGGMMGGMGM